MLDSVESRGVNGSRDRLGSESRLAVEEGVFKASEPLGELIFPPFLEETFEMMSSIVYPWYRSECSCVVVVYAECKPRNTLYQLLVDRNKLSMARWWRDEFVVVAVPMDCLSQHMDHKETLSNLNPEGASFQTHPKIDFKTHGSQVA